MEQYYKELEKYRNDETTEHSFRSALQQLLERIGGKGVKIIHEPKREGKFGAPDFKIIHTESIIGYVETKKMEDNLDKSIMSDQIKKYKELSGNILLTNYLDWIWIRNGKIQQRESLCTLNNFKTKRGMLDERAKTTVEQLLRSFLSQPPKEISDPKKLANALAVRAKMLKTFLFEELTRQESENKQGRLLQLFSTFKQYVFKELKVEDFADTFAQNLVYGLFLAKLNADSKVITLYNARQFIPSSFVLIQELVDFLYELDKNEYRETKWIVEEVLTIINNLDIGALQIKLSFTTKVKGVAGLPVRDPYIYFYEDFLASYDNKLRKAKGVYYTPPSVVSFIIRVIDDILIKEFKIREGLADRKAVTLLDFATGTGTFLLEVFQQIFDKLPENSGKKQPLIKEHLLKNIYGFEYLIAPYTIAHLKLSQFLKDNSYQLGEDERLKIFLTNTLEPVQSQIKIPFLPALSEESIRAQEIKDNPVLVITGNPPYSNYSKNKGSYIGGLLEEYKKDLHEKKTNLDDDYIKFIRFAQDKMEYSVDGEGKRVRNTRDGIIGIITNNSFLSGLTHRRMRESLLQTFNKIYILNLHGEALENSPDGSKDENVFDITKGVAISFFIKQSNSDEKGLYYAELYGDRLKKYQELSSLNYLDINWEALNVDDEYRFFKPFDYKGLGLFKKNHSVIDIFKIYGTGVKTDRDSLFFDFDTERLSNRIKALLSNPDKDFVERYNVKDSSSYRISSKIINKKFNERYITQCLYRPFDIRYLYYDPTMISRPGEDTMMHISGKSNIVLTVKRQNIFDPFSYVFVADKLSESCLFESSYANNSVFPLYTYFDGNKAVNFTKEFSDYIERLYGNHCTPEEILAYIYAVLHSPTYRNKYSEFLKIDFPRVPFTDDLSLFSNISALGERLIAAHLLDNDIVDDLPNSSLGKFKGIGDRIVKKVEYIQDKQTGKVRINKEQYFEHITPDLWEFQIGGYQVIKKYLEQRKSRQLSLDEIDDVERIVRTIAYTMKQMKEIDILTKDWI